MVKELMKKKQYLLSSPQASQLFLALSILMILSNTSYAQLRKDKVFEDRHIIDNYFESDTVVTIIERGKKRKGLKEGIWVGHYDVTGALASKISYTKGVHDDTLLLMYHYEGQLIDKLITTDSAKINVSYDEFTGEITDSLIYKNGVKYGVGFFESGSKRFEFTKVDTSELWCKKRFWPNGNLLDLTCFKGEVEHGISKRYYDNGKLRYECSLVDGVLEGEYIEYDEDGNITSVTFYENGQIIRE